ncbi:MAG: LysR family transcriptional regulator [Hyphomicrobiales bacterium]|nr:LysR family transcriptional regulator [Hyphomicrobiales bacterium]
MDIENLSLLLDVAQRGSFAAAAKERAIDPSSVSRVIARLEEELGLRLFQRSTRRLTLTEAGDAFVKRLDAILEELRRARSEALDMTETVSGTLRLTASVAYGEICVMPLVGEFRRLYPDLKLDLVFTDSNLDLVGERIDLAIRLGAALQGDVIASKLVDTHYKLVASPGWLTTHRAPPTPEALSSESCLLLDLPGFRSGFRYRSATGAEKAVDIAGDILVSTPLALRGAVLAGLGPAMLADWLVADPLADGRLIDLFPGLNVTPTSFTTAAWIVYPSRAFLPRKVRAMVDFLKEHIGRRGA